MAGQDYKRHITAGGSTRINANGETYIFCKFSDRDVTVDIAGRKVVMRTGSYMEFAPLRGENSAVTIYNDDSENPAAVLFVLGVGTYDEKLIRGEISIEPILRNSDGTIKPDTRYQLPLSILPENLSVTAYERGDLIKLGEALKVPGATTVDVVGSAAIFAGPNGFPVVTYSYNARNDGGWYQLDWDLKLINQGTENLYSAVEIGVQSSMTDVGWTPTDGFVSIRGSGLYRQGIDEKTRIYTFGQNDLFSMCYVPEKNSIILTDFDGSYFEEIDATTKTLKRKGPTGWSGQCDLRCDWATGKLWGNFGGAMREINYETMERGPSFSAPVISFPSFVPRGDNIYGTYGAYSPTKPVSVSKVALNDYVTKPEFVAVKPGCEAMVAMARQNTLPQIKANVEITETMAGVTIKGEVIRALLEYYFRQEAPADYLEHIYFADLGRQPNGVPIKPIFSGNETFARAGIKDDFEINIPGEVELTIDSELTMGALL